jgi:hypothetical protein
MTPDEIKKWLKPKEWELYLEAKDVGDKIMVAALESLAECRATISNFVEVHNMAKTGNWDGSLAVYERWNKCIGDLAALLAGLPNEGGKDGK